MSDESLGIIRKFQAGDREEVRKLCCLTAFMGEPSSLFFEGDEVFADAITLYFTDYEPESCFVADCQEKVRGYLIGTKDVSVTNRILQKTIIPQLFMKAITSGIFLKYKNLRFFWHCLASLTKGEFIAPDFSKVYPATLHINIEEGFRGMGIGARLIEAYMDYLTTGGVRGVHFATISERASNFFSKQHFDLLYVGCRSYFRYILHRDIPIYFYGKQLI